ncbi:hypothetical protein HYH03_017726 [Edaphochlamys debaryana]|uniref:SGNH hydrolase-type esterase domain-containing protein n=1 Tax=Edaphochlamys debaryana TaxID=47281 RepID=A0A835XHC1_9CHLO|nr:hypothetical protein HYH03_017726 [Edaphochlamys debaryana]|eukprot:KAG2483419.1 hypothetical protein HYH03_017726 [Edaphochlamys debaryana]
MAAVGAASYVVSPSRPRIILFGDSLTERGFEVPGGWANSLAYNYSRRADIVNRGLSGYNTRWAVKAMPYVYGTKSAPPGSEVLFTTLFFGANDAARLEGPAHSARQHVSVDEYGKNLREMVAYVRSCRVQRVVLLTPPPVWEPGRKAHQISRMGEEARDWPLDRTAEHTAPYAREAAAVAADLGVPCLDLHSLLQQEDQWGERLLVDGLHFTPAGQERLWALLRELLAKEWPEIRPEVLPMHFPPWEAVDQENPGATFAASAGDGGA